MKYAITGHRGLIGEYLKKRLDSEGNKCVLNIDQREGFNVMDLMFKEQEFNDKIDIFYHFAAQCKINEAIAKPILPHKNNVDGILAVLEFCRKYGIPKIVTASSSRVLSKEKNPYTASKIYTEELTKAYHDCYGLEYLIIRPSTVFGPFYDETSRLMSVFITNAMKGKDLKIYGDHNKTLDFTYIDDFVDGVMIAHKKWNDDYNISGEQETNICALAAYIIAKTNSNSNIIFMELEIAQPQNVKVDISKIKILGFKPKYNIWQGVDKMIEFYNQHKDAVDNFVDKGEKYYGNNKRID